MHQTDKNTAIVITHFGNEILIQTDTQERIRAVPRTSVIPLVTGDFVHWHSNPTGAATITDVLERSNELARHTKGKRKVITANIDHTIIVAAATPDYRTRLIDRYLCASETADINPIILFNKTDLLSEDELTDVQRALRPYSRIGYQVIYTSATSEDKMSELLAVLENKIAILVGQSGVGKSSIIRTLVPGSDPAIGDISSSTNKGKHTTTHSEIFSTSNGGHIIDSPGIREFGLEPMPAAELSDCFIEFREHKENCKFRDCIHNGEKGCAVKKAVSDGEISALRLESYQALLADMN